MLEVNKVYRLSETVTIKNILNETFFLLDSNSGKQYNLTEMEFEIVNMLMGGKSIKEIQMYLLSKYDAGEKQIENDLMEYICDLISANLISEAT